MLICNQCIIRAEMGFPKYKFTRTGEMKFDKCGICGKKHMCTEYEMLLMAENSNNNASEAKGPGK